MGTGRASTAGGGGARPAGKSTNSIGKEWSDIPRHTIHRLGGENQHSTVRHRGSASTDTCASGLVASHHYKSMGLHRTIASSSSTATSPTPCSRPPSNLQIMPEAPIVEEDPVQSMQLSTNSAAMQLSTNSGVSARSERYSPPSSKEATSPVVQHSEDSRRSMEPTESGCSLAWRNM